MSHLIQRNDKPVFVSVRLPTISTLSYSVDASLYIQRGSVKVTKAGKKQITIERKMNADAQQLASDTFLQANVNQIIAPEHIKNNPFSEVFHVHASALFTEYTSDETIKELAREWAESIIRIYTDEINKVNQNLSELTERARQSENLFTNEPN